MGPNEMTSRIADRGLPRPRPLQPADLPAVRHGFSPQEPSSPSPHQESANRITNGSCLIVACVGQTVSGVVGFRPPWA